MQTTLANLITKVLVSELHQLLEDISTYKRDIEDLSGCLTKNHAERFKLKIRFPLYFYHELPLSLKVLN
jgi:hypothetical protein